MNIRNSKIILPVGILAITLACNRPADQQFKSGWGITTENGMVVSAHPEASMVGARILAEGGNAYDAAVATQFALAVSYPVAGNIGGGGFYVVRRSDGSSATLDFREKAPLAASIDMFQDEEGNVIKGASTSTRLANGVPGAVAGAMALHDKYGRLPFTDVIQPAIDLARNGFEITKAQAESFNHRKKTFNERNTYTISLVKDTLWKEGDLLIQPELAHTLELIRDKGADGFYQGETAEKIVKEMRKGGGLITLEDLASYQAIWRDPVEFKYLDYNVISMPPPSSGGVALAQLLIMTEQNIEDVKGFHTPPTIHLMVESERRVYADRAEYLGDPDFVDVPVKALLGRDYLKERMSDFNRDQKTPSEEVGAGNLSSYESEETTHFSIVDNEGNAVSATTTLNSGYGNGIMVEGAGFLLNNEMDDFSVKPGYPNIYGLIGGYANSVQPGKRMLSSMTPTIIEKDGKLFMVVGTPGGSTIMTSVYQVVMNVINFNMNMQEAVDAGRFHHQWMPDVVMVERDRFDSTLVHQLEVLGHSIRTRSAIGRVDAILVRPDGLLEAGADRRGDDIAVGY